MTRRTSKGLVLVVLAGLASLNRACASDADSLGVSVSLAGAAGQMNLPRPIRGAGGTRMASLGGATNSLPEAPRRAPEPAGASVVTFLHGVADAPNVALCFSKDSADGQVSLSERPWPTGGMAFGASERLDAPAGLDVDKETLVAVLVAGESNLLESTTCAEVNALLAVGGGLNQKVYDPSVAAADAAFAGAAGTAGSSGAGATAGAYGMGGTSGASGQTGSGGALGVGGQLGGGGVAGAGNEPRGIRVRLLGGLPSGTFSASTSYLFAATGCLGAPNHTHKLEALVCGAGYTPKTSTLTPLLVSLSRITTFNAPGLQVVNGSLGESELSLLTQPGPLSVQTPVTIVSGLSFGTIGPFPPYAPAPPTEYWTPVGATLRVDSNQLEVIWKNLLQRSGIATLEIAKNYSVILVGPAPAVTEAGWWNAATLSLIANDPPPAK
ncbi:MAG: hypothetical protein SFV15_02355 [Polyangiaceae bacterium]|nr:hypothetical protein [Polyangiaceae bacterium]